MDLISFKNKVEVPDKIWLNMYNDQGAFSQILIGFIQGASPSFEPKSVAE